MAILWALLVPGDLGAQSSPHFPSAEVAVDDLDPASVDWSDDVPGHIAVIDGAAWLERDNTVEPATENIPLLAGDRLRTERGRLEVLFADGTILDLDERSTVDLLSDSLMRLQQGRVRVSLARTSSPVDYRVDAAGTSTVLRSAGEYRLTVEDDARGGGRVAVSVIRGAAELDSPYGRTLVRTGYEAWSTAATAPTSPYVASMAFGDAFSRWSDGLHQDDASASSGRYLPAEIRAYGGLFDRYGSWQYDTSYGYIWYPRVDTTWRPYSQGRWSFVGSLGWTWVGTDRWSWPTHHYGRWGVSGSRWYWIPDHQWAPAWVSWAEAPGYVSWCPLGHNNRPLGSAAVGYGAAGRVWTTVPVGRFSNTIIVDARSRVQSIPDVRFVERRTAPWRLAVAPPRNQPIRGPRARAAAPPRPESRNPIEMRNATRAGTARAIAPTRASEPTPPVRAPRPRTEPFRTPPPASPPIERRLRAGGPPRAVPESSYGTGRQTAPGAPGRRPQPPPVDDRGTGPTDPVGVTSRARRGEGPPRTSPPPSVERDRPSPRSAPPEPAAGTGSVPGRARARPR